MTTHTVVLGAGYTGLAAAKLAARWTDSTVTLINAGDRFIERVRMHQLASGQQLTDRPLTELLAGTGVELIVDKVTGIDATARRVQRENGPDIGYDQLIYALGSRADLDSVPGVAEHAYAVASAAQATRLRDRLPEAETVAVVGGGLTGIEAASEIAETHPNLRVHLVTVGPLGEALSVRGKRYLRKAFGRLGIEVHDDTRVAKVHADGLDLDGGGRLAADTVVWTTGFQVSDLAREAGFAVDPTGRMIVDETLRSTSHPEVTGVGDAAAVHREGGQELRMACATGLPTTQQALKAIAARHAGKPVRPVRFKFVNQCISLGRRDGLIQFTRPDDSPREMILTGRAAAMYKEGIVRSTVMFERHPTMPASL